MQVKLILFYTLFLVLLLSGCGSESLFYNLPQDPKTNSGERPDPGTVSDILSGGETRAIVVYNEDVPDSKEIAEYYAKQRGIPKLLLSGVHVPNSLYGTPDDLLSVRSQIINQTLCPVFAPGRVCNSDDFSALFNARILPNHLAIIKGIPTQLRDTGWATSTNPVPILQGASERIQPTSFDFYLSQLLLSDKATCLDASCFAGANSNGLNLFVGNNQYSYYFRSSYLFNPSEFLSAGYPMGSGQIPELSTHQYHSFAYGRIDGITTKNAKEIIDRTLLAELNGFNGNIFGSRYATVSPIEYELAEYTGSLDPVCLPSSGTGTIYPVSGNASCRIQFSESNIPISAGGNVLSVNKVAGFFGQDPMFYYGDIITQYGFINDFAKLLTWRHTTDPCTSLCSDMTNWGERNECEVRSLDPFKTINTSCVGLEPGFVGTQYRSFPVQFMGSYAKDWKTVTMGPATTTPMELSWEGGVQTERFTDTRYVYFGDPTYRDSNKCYDRKGQQRACHPKVEIYAHRTFNLSSPLIIDSNQKDIEFSFYWKGFSAESGRVSFLIQYLTTSNQVAFQETFDISILGSQDNWSLLNSRTKLNSSLPVTVDRIKFLAFSPTSDGSDPDYNTGYKRIPLYGYFALDGISARVKKDKSIKELIPADAGSFNEPYINTLTAGSWAGDTLGRMGGTAFFGSMSHFLTGGNAWSNRSTILRSFFSGNTLGESLLYAGTGISGIFYGDPLFSIGGPALYMEPELFQSGGALSGKNLNLTKQDLTNLSPLFPTGGTVLIKESSPDSVKTSPLYFDASFGKLNRLKYRVEICGPISQLTQCHWDLLAEGDKVVKHSIVPGSENGVFSLARGTGYHFIRVKVFPEGEEERALYRYIKFYFVTPVGELPPALIFNQARFVGSDWDPSLREDSNVDTLLYPDSLRYADINQFVVQCNSKAKTILGIPCNTEHWSLSIRSKTGWTIPSFSSYEESVFESFAFPAVRRTTFKFMSNLKECERYNIVLTNGSYTVTFPWVAYLPEDANGDGSISQADLINFRNIYGTNIDPNSYGDFNGDLISNQRDFNQIRSVYGCSLP